MPRRQVLEVANGISDGEKVVARCRKRYLKAVGSRPADLARANTGKIDNLLIYLIILGNTQPNLRFRQHPDNLNQSRFYF